ncbi:MAG TPA: hypothetical protein VFS89_08405 [Nitrosospira sp.]|nr:hypothetical protein [Nitrosospira sp.]
MKVYKIQGAVTNKYQGAGPAVAAIAGEKIINLVYVRDVIDEMDEEDEDSIANALVDVRLGPTVRELSALGEVFVGMCSCHEFIVM